MKRVFISSPYAATSERSSLENVVYARDAVRHSLDQGEAPFASHLLYPNVLDDTDPRDRARAMQAAFEWLSTSDLVAFYVDHGWSHGMLQELKAARLFHRLVEVRSLHKRYSLDVPDEVLLLADAGLIREEPHPVKGVRMFRFIKGDDL